MKQIFYLLILIVCAIAAPVDDRPILRPEDVQTKLYRPSPINPDIPSERKPEDKVTLINTDYTKKKRDITQEQPVASVLPANLPAVVGNPNEYRPKIQTIPLKYPDDEKVIHGQQKRDTLPRPSNHQVTPGYIEQQQKEEELKQKEQQDQKSGDTKQKRDVVPQTLPVATPPDQQQSRNPGPLTREQDRPGHLTREQDKPGHLTREQDKPSEQKYYKRDTAQKLPTPSDQKIPSLLGQQDKKDEDQKQQKRQTPQTPQTLPAQLPNNDKNAPGSVNQQQNDDKNNNQKQQKRDTAAKESTPGQTVQQQKKDEPNKQPSVQPTRNPQRPQRRESPQRRPVPLPGRQPSSTTGTVNQQVKKDDSVKKLRRDVPVPATQSKKSPTSPDHDDDKDDSKEDKPIQSSRPKIAQKRETDNNKNSDKSSEEHLGFVRPVPVSQIFGSRTSSTEKSQSALATDDKKSS